MHKWIKLGNIYNPYEDTHRPDWRWNYAQGVNTLNCGDFIRVYSCCRERPDAEGKTISRVFYVDLDRRDLTKVLRVSPSPVFDIGQLGTFDEFGVYPFSVVRTGGKIHAYYGGVTRCESVPFNVAIGYAVSTEGEKFERIGKGPILSYSLDEPFVVCSPKIRIYNNLWYLFYSAGRQWVAGDTRPEIYYKLRMATSHDGINWQKHGSDLINDKLGPDEAQACGDVIYKNGKYHMFFCYRQNMDFRRNKYLCSISKKQ